MMLQLIHSFLFNYGDDLALALISSFIFYLIMIYYPTKHSVENSSNFLIEKYKEAKINIIELILMTLGRALGHQNLLNENYTDNIYLRKLISNKDINEIRSLNEIEIKELSCDIYYYLSDLQTFLSKELSKPYIQAHKAAFRRVSDLISLIDQFHHHHITISLEQDCDKYLRNYIQGFILGLNSANRACETPLDLFPEIIKSAYNQTLLSEKVKKLCGSLLNT